MHFFQNLLQSFRVSKTNSNTSWIKDDNVIFFICAMEMPSHRTIDSQSPWSAVWLRNVCDENSTSWFSPTKRCWFLWGFGKHQCPCGWLIGSLEVPLRPVRGKITNHVWWKNRNQGSLALCMLYTWLLPNLKVLVRGTELSFVRQHPVAIHDVNTGQEGTDNKPVRGQANPLRSYTHHLEALRYFLIFPLLLNLRNRCISF